MRVYTYILRAYARKNYSTVETVWIVISKYKV